MSEAAHKVIYAEGPQELAVVENLPHAALDLEVASDILWLLSASYSFQWEHRARGRFHRPEGTLDAHFTPGSATNQHAQLSHMQSEIDQGKQYWVTRDLGNEVGRIISLTKVTPLRPAGFSIYDDYEPDCYFNDVLTLPEFQRQGYGIRGVHATITEGGFNPAGQISLDGFIGNMGPNRFFARTLGLRRDHTLKIAPFAVTDYDDRTVTRLQQVRYQTPAGLTIAGVAERLEARKPWLRSAVRVG